MAKIKIVNEGPSIMGTKIWLDDVEVISVERCIIDLNANNKDLGMKAHLIVHLDQLEMEGNVAVVSEGQLVKKSLVLGNGSVDIVTEE